MIEKYTGDKFDNEDIRITKNGNKYQVENQIFNDYEQAVNYANENYLIYDQTFNEWYKDALTRYVEYNVENDWHYNTANAESDFPKILFDSFFFSAWKKIRKQDGDGDDLWGELDNIVYECVN